MTNKRDLADSLAKFLESLDDQPKEVRPTIDALWESWFSGMCEMKSKATALSIRAAWKHLRPRVGHMHPEAVTGELWTNSIIPGIRKDTHECFKFFNIRKWLSMFLKWCEENNKGPSGWRRPRLIDPDPARDDGRAYSTEETDGLIANADWLLLPKIIMALEHFMRRSEIALLSKDRVDRKKQIIHLRAIDTKIRRARSFPYNNNLETLFCVMDQKHSELKIVSPWVFPSPINPERSIGRDGFSSAWETCKLRAGVIGKFHWLRHTALTRAFRAGGNPALICQMAGLDIAMAQKVYLHFSTDDLREVIKK